MLRCWGPLQTSMGGVNLHPLSAPPSASKCLWLLRNVFVAPPSAGVASLGSAQDCCQVPTCPPWNNSAGGKLVRYD